ncbi:MAG: lipopolysaccharide biosynthesis protein [Pseudomonadota bacterium]
MTDLADTAYRDLEPSRPSDRPLGKIKRALAVLRSRDPEHLPARQAVGIFALRGVSAGIAYLSQVFLARWMGGTEYGIFVSVWSWLLMVALVSSLGLSITVLRFLQAARADGASDLERGVLWGTRAISLTISTAMMLAGIGLVWLLQDTVGSAYILPAVLVLICLPMFALMDVQDGIARSYDWMDLALVPPYIARPIILLLCIGAIAAIGLPATATMAAGSAIVATWVTCIVQTLLLRRRLRGEVEPGPKRLKMREWVVVSLPVLFSDSFAFLLLNADVLVLTMLRPPEEVAIYFAATRTISLIAFIAFAVAAASGHRFAEAHATGNAEALRSMLTRSVAWTLWPSLAAAVFIIAVGPFVLSLFGPQFTVGYAPMCVLAIGFLVRAAVGSSERLLNMAGAERACALVYIAALAVNLTLNVTLIPIYGLMGAAIATVCALTVESAGLAWLIRSRFAVSIVSGWNPRAAFRSS